MRQGRGTNPVCHSDINNNKDSKVTSKGSFTFSRPDHFLKSILVVRVGGGRGRGGVCRVMSTLFMFCEHKDNHDDDNHGVLKRDKINLHLFQGVELFWHLLRQRLGWRLLKRQKTHEVLEMTNSKSPINRLANNCVSNFMIFSLQTVKASFQWCPNNSKTPKVIKGSAARKHITFCKDRAILFLTSTNHNI